MSAKIVFDTKEEIPEHLQPSAAAVEGKWQLDAAGVLNKNIELLSKIGQTKKLQAELDTLRTVKDNLEREIEEAKAKTLPAGYRAVTKEVAALGAAAKTAGYAAPDEIVQTKARIAQFEQAQKEQTERAVKSKALKLAGVEDEEAFFALKQSDALQFEFETVDGKEKPFVVTETNGQKEKKAFDRKFLEEAEGFKTVVPVLFNTAKEGNIWGRQESGKGDTNAKPALENEIKTQIATGRYAL